MESSIKLLQDDRFRRGLIEYTKILEGTLKNEGFQCPFLSSCGTNLIFVYTLHSPFTPIN